MRKISIIINSAKKSLKGEEKLWVVFWLWFVALLAVCWSFNMLITPVVYRNLLDSLPLLFLNIAFALDMIITIGFRSILIIIIWRCARNTEYRIWFYLARILALIFLFLTLYGSVLSISNAVIKYYKIKEITNKY